MICVGDLYHLLNFFSFSRWLFIGLATLGLIVHRYRHPEIASPFQVMKLLLWLPLHYLFLRPVALWWCNVVLKRWMCEPRNPWFWLHSAWIQSTMPASAEGVNTHEGTEELSLKPKSSEGIWSLVLWQTGRLHGAEGSTVLTGLRPIVESDHWFISWGLLPTLAAWESWSGGTEPETFWIQNMCCKPWSL